MCDVGEAEKGFYQWYQSSHSSHPIMGLPSSGLLHPGQIHILLPHSSRICDEQKHKHQSNKSNKLNTSGTGQKEKWKQVIYYYRHVTTYVYRVGGLTEPFKPLKWFPVFKTASCFQWNLSFQNLIFDLRTLKKTLRNFSQKKTCIT